MIVLEFVICKTKIVCMELSALKEAVKGIDIYVLDQILKDKYPKGSKILDAGCGKGRNLKWFYQAGFEIYGIDLNEASLLECKEMYPTQKENFIHTSIEQLPYKDFSMDHIICNAVLHFAESERQFFKIFNELLRVLKCDGSLLIRVASNFGIETEVEHLENGVYILPDNSNRFLLTKTIFEKLLNIKGVKLVEDIKTTIVHSKRSMTTIILQKE